MKRNINLLLHDILNSAQYILEFTSDNDFDSFIKDEKTKSAVIQKFEVIGEATKNISVNSRSQFFLSSS